MYLKPGLWNPGPGLGQTSLTRLSRQGCQSTRNSNCLKRSYMCLCSQAENTLTHMLGASHTCTHLWTGIVRYSACFHVFLSTVQVYCKVLRIVSPVQVFQVGQIAALLHPQYRTACYSKGLFTVTVRSRHFSCRLKMGETHSHITSKRSKV